MSYPINDAITGVTAMELEVSGGTAVIKNAVTGRVVYNMPSFPSGVLTKKALAASEVSAIPCENGVAYTYTPTATTNFGFDVSSLGSDSCPTFELWVTMGSTVQTISFPNTVLWDDGSGNYSAENTPPSAETASKTYVFVFRWNGTAICGNLAMVF